MGSCVRVIMERLTSVLIPLLAVLVYGIYVNIPLRLSQFIRIGVHDHLQHICPAPSVDLKTLNDVRVCPSTPTGQAQGCILPPQVSSNLPPVGVTKWDTVCCSYLEESLDRTNCVVEEDIYLILGDILEKDDVVLEIGSRYGVVSCAISAILGDSSNVITVEADPDVWKIHQYNKLMHNCRSHSVFGVMAEEDLVVLSNTTGYAKRTAEVDANNNNEGERVAHFTWDDIEKETGLTITTLIVDCEGCLFSLIETYKHKFSQINKIILENDENPEEGFLDLLYYNSCGEKCQNVNTFLESQGFREERVLKSLHYHYVFIRN